MKNKYKYLIVVCLLVFIMVLSAFTKGEDNSNAAFFRDVIIQADQVIEGDNVVFFGNATINGHVKGDAAAILGNVVVNGRVDGDIAAVFGNVYLGEKAVAGGDVAGVMGKVTKEPGAIIKGEIADVKAPMEMNRHSAVPMLTAAYVVFVAITYFFYCFLVVLVPDRLNVMADQFQKNMARRYLIGLIMFIVFIPINLLLVLSIVGIFLVPVFSLAVMFLVFIASAVTALFIGNKVMKQQESKNSIYLKLLVGTVLLYMLMAIPIIGWLVFMTIISISVGVVLDTRVGNKVVL